MCCWRGETWLLSTKRKLNGCRFFAQKPTRVLQAPNRGIFRTFVANFVDHTAREPFNRIAERSQGLSVFLTLLSSN
jgi:hypothetical protein